MKHTPHNPDNLTPEQIGVTDGWRLMSREEVESRDIVIVPTSEIQGFLPILGWAKWVGSGLYMTCRTRLPLGYWLCNESGERIGDPDAVWAHEVESATKLPSEDPRRFELIKNLCQNGSLVLSYSPETNAKRILATADAILAQLNKEPTS